MEKYQIWIDGPNFIGTSEGRTFKAACDYLLDGFVGYDSNKLTYWGNKLHSNKTEVLAN